MGLLCPFRCCLRCHFQVDSGSSTECCDIWYSCFMWWVAAIIDALRLLVFVDGLVEVVDCCENNKLTYNKSNQKMLVAGQCLIQSTPRLRGNLQHFHLFPWTSNEAGTSFAVLACRGGETTTTTQFSDLQLLHFCMRVS